MALLARRSPGGSRRGCGDRDHRPVLLQGDPRPVPEGRGLSPTEADPAGSDAPAAAGGPVDWQLAERVATRFTGSEDFSRSYHYEGMEADFERLTTEAQRYVEAEVGFTSLAGEARGRVVGREDWVRANIASYRRLLRPLLER
ncbi:MAG: zinc-dependent metalloprotease, partial [Microthrixaceae bacterium]|nr:zinc-dependent metalloprotease [Microthrixaceae bacterium]